MLKEFKPSLIFLAKFFAIYVIGNIVYGLFVEAYGDKADPVTVQVTQQTSSALNFAGYSTIAIENEGIATVSLRHEGRVILSVFEGCNGLNVMIVFCAFIIAFNGTKNKMIWFIPAGLLLIHACNVLRIFLLYVVALSYHDYFYFVHKYFFTAILYCIVFALWAIWVIQFNVRQGQANRSSPRESH